MSLRVRVRFRQEGYRSIWLELQLRPNILAAFQGAGLHPRSARLKARGNVLLAVHPGIRADLVLQMTAGRWRGPHLLEATFSRRRGNLKLRSCRRNVWIETGG